jgi:N-acetylated-alpha-linked acidic dipeptidase
MSPPPAKQVPPFMNFAPLKNGVEAIKKSAERYQAAFAKWQASGIPLPARTATALNAELIQIQRTFLTEKGLPERPWFKHQVYAPGAYTGYGAKPIAAVREYMDQEKWKEADAQVPLVGQVLENVAARSAKLRMIWRKRAGERESRPHHVPAHSRGRA